MMNGDILTVNELYVSFKTDRGKAYAVRGVNLSVKPGETLAVVGESGSGKSVTTKAVLGILPPNAAVESGEVIYDGRDILKLSEKELCRIRGSHIAMIFQDPMSSLDPIVKIGKQITETIRLREGMRRESAKRLKELAVKLLGEVGITDPEKRFGQYPFELSGGMRQRVVIAIALAADPKVLICDEPTTALDVTVQAQILELIGRLKKERGLAVVFITHDLGVVANVADRVAVMYAGRIVEEGGVNDVFYAPAHPYTWALMSSMPDLDTKVEPEAIPGAPPIMGEEIKGDAFAPRNKYALLLDFEKEPPMFKISDTHKAATWLLHPEAPHCQPPDIIVERCKRYMKKGDCENANG